MGDLRLLRHSIIHHRGIVHKEVKKCQLLKWFSEGDQVMIDEDKFKEMVFHVKSYIATLRQQLQLNKWYNKKPSCSKAWACTNQ